MKSLLEPLLFIFRCFKKFLPIILLILFILIAVFKSEIKEDPEGEMQIKRFAELPVVYQGRVKPYDTLARNTLTILIKKQTFVDKEGVKQPAIKFLLDLISYSEVANDHKVFHIPSLQLQDALELKRVKRFRYAFNDFKDKIQTFIAKEMERIRELEADHRDSFDLDLIDLDQKIRLFTMIRDSFANPRLSSEEEIRFSQRFIQFMKENKVPHPIPPTSEDGEWGIQFETVFNNTVAEIAPNSGFKVNESAKHLQSILVSYRDGDINQFNQSVEDYEKYLGASPPPKTELVSFEVFFNHFDPFTYCCIIYALIFLLTLFSAIGWTKELRHAALYLCIWAVVIHSAALIARMFLSGYPPVTNLYSSAIFIGWGCVFIGIIVEFIFKIGIGNLMAAVSGFLTLIIAHFLAGDGDTMQMMQAVLDTRFWLATHVVTVTLGYSATFLAGFAGIYYIFVILHSSKVDKTVDKNISMIIYGITCFALFLSFVGTVLGGLWADDSWGRFWGWDPKENGALMIVLWNALILHARWGGIVRTRGLAALAVFGNIITAWSWFGVNELGVGLHAYGFREGAKFWLSMFALFNVAVILLAMMPKRFFGEGNKPDNQPEPPKQEEATPTT